MAKLKVALVLGGGAARGLAHLGVIQVLEQAGIPIDMIVGSSMGALVGAMYAGGGGIESILERVREYLHSPEFAESKIHSLRRGEEEELGLFDQVSKAMKKAQLYSSTVTRQSYFTEDETFEFFSHFVDERDIRSLRIPFYAVASDLSSGEQVVIDSGPVILATAASSAIPGAFPPIKVRDRICIDGGMVNMVPATVALTRGADFVIAVNVSHELPRPSELKRALRIYFRAHEITKQTLIAHQIKFADIVLTPNVGKTHWADFGKADELIESGVAVAREKLPAIFAMLQRLRRTPRLFWKRSVKLKRMIP